MKKKSLVSYLFFILALLIMNVFALSVHASSVDVVVSNENPIIFKDLFHKFHNVMPGDKVTETITITNDFSDYDYIKVYMKAEPNTLDNVQSTDNATDETIVSMEEFLSILRMRVNVDGKEIFDGAPNQPGTLAENVLLAQLNLNESTLVNVDLDVPITMGNEYANRQGEVDWIFTVEAFNHGEGGDDPEKGNLPATGDNGKMILWFCGAALSGAILVLIVWKKRK